MNIIQSVISAFALIVIFVISSASCTAEKDTREPFVPDAGFGVSDIGELTTPTPPILGIPTPTATPIADGWKRISVREGIFGMDTFFRYANFYISVPETWYVFDTPSMSRGLPQGTIKGFARSHPGGNPQLQYEISNADNFTARLAGLRSDESREMWVEEIGGVKFHMWQRGDQKSGRFSIGALVSGIPNAPDNTGAMIRLSTSGNFSGFQPDDLFAAIRSIEYAPPVDPLPVPDPKITPDSTWRSPTFLFEGDHDPGIPFTVKTPDRSGMTATVGYDSISGSIGTSGLSIEYETGLIGSPEPVGEHAVPQSGAPVRKFWKDVYAGRVTYFWRDAAADGTFPLEGGLVGAYLTRTGSPIKLHSTVSNANELELVFAIIRTIR